MGRRETAAMGTDAMATHPMAAVARASVSWQRRPMRLARSLGLKRSMGVSKAF